jgi:tetrahydromethanopterin S-methyltransferase subunit G
VRFVSLVARGANRIPFRFTKKDESPVDFFKFFHKSEAAPPVEASVEPPETGDAAVAAKLDALVRSLDELSGLVQSRLDAIDARFEAVEATVRKTEASMKGAVIGIAYGDPPAAPARPGKAVHLPPLLDTGMAGFGSPG